MAPEPAPEPEVVAAPEMSPVEPDDVVVIIVDEVPVVVPADIVDVIVNLAEDEREAYLESEKVKRFIKKVNMCVAKG